MKKLLCAATALLLCLFLTLPSFAAETSEDYVNDTLEELSDDLKAAIPEETQELLYELSLEELSLPDILSLQPEQFLHLLKELLSEKWQAPKRTLGQLLALLILCSLLFPLKDSILKGEAARIFTLAALVCLCLILAEPIQGAMAATVRALEHGANFLLALIPILCGILAVGGQAATAGTYHLLLFALCQLVSQLAVSGLLPLLGIYHGLSMIGGIFPELGLQGLVDGIKSFVCWGLGLLTTIFVGLLSLQTFVSSSVDVVTLKTSRFLMGSFIPVVGSILSEAFGAAQGCISLIKGTVGSFGIIAALCMILPPLLELLLWYFCCWLALRFSDLLQLKEVSALLKSSCSCFTILLAFLLSFLLLLLVGTSLVIFMGTGGH